MNEREALAEILGVVVKQLRKAKDLMHTDEPEDVWKASDLLQDAANTVASARWMALKGGEA
jgi:hypothetical protein